MNKHYMVHLTVKTIGGAVDQKADLKGILFLRLSERGWRNISISEDRLTANHDHYNVGDAVETAAERFTNWIGGPLNRNFEVTFDIYEKKPLLRKVCVYDCLEREVKNVE